ncbi:MAG: alpha/beta hydrolase [Planctomycetota bacterium]|jgi:pimeloyl-ACP methyl ester carboxylesterase
MLSTLPILVALAGPSPTPVVAPLPIVHSVAIAAEPALVRTDDKLALRGDFYPPRRGENRVPAVLLVHDAGSDRASVASIAEALQRADFGVLAIDLRGHGESVSEDLDWSEADEEKRAKAWMYATRDLDAGAGWLADQDGIHSTNLTVIGVGAGGALAVRHALRDDNVRGVGLIGLEEKPFGFDLAEDLYDLEGLPILMSVAAEERTAAEELVTDLEGDDWITIKPFRSEREELLGEKKLPRAVVEFAEQHAKPSRRARG